MNGHKAPLRAFYLIALVWVVSITLEVVWPMYDAPATIHALMMLAASWAFGRGLVNRKENG
jgi:hypothetical protein